MSSCDHPLFLENIQNYPGTGLAPHFKCLIPLDPGKVNQTHQFLLMKTGPLSRRPLMNAPGSFIPRRLSRTASWCSS